MARVLETEGKKMNFSRSYRASIDRIESISFEVPPYDFQNKIMEQVLSLEKQISKLENHLKKLDGKKSIIISSYFS